MSAGEWRHAICRTCWDRRRQGQEPVRLREPDPQVCCYCGVPTTSGIYVRDDPQRVHAQGRA